MPPDPDASLGLFQPKANKTVFFFVSFHQGATQSGILFLVSIERGTSRRVYHHRPWLSDTSQLGGAPCRFLAPLAVARVGVSDRWRNAYMVSARFPVRSHGLSEPLDESLCHLLDRLGSTGILE